MRSEEQTNTLTTACDDEDSGNGSSKQVFLEGRKPEANADGEGVQEEDINRRAARKLSDEIMRLSGRYTRQALPSEKLIQSSNLKVFKPEEFEYYRLLGSGAFGKVRKCRLKQNCFGQACVLESDSPFRSSVDEEEMKSDEAMRDEGGSGTKTSDRTACSLTDCPENGLLEAQPSYSAVKLQSKYQLIKGKQEEHLFNEIEIMNELDHPFILKMQGVAQDKRIIFMYVDFMRQGDLMGVLNEFKQMPVDMARFYAAQIVVCFEYLHAKCLIYRDLKPENILLGSDGCIRMADFGFVKKLSPWERTLTFCGTPEYMAPEIILNSGYSQPVDWYALGIMLFELLYGRPPFMAQSPMDVFQMILNQKILFTKTFDPAAKSLIKHLCDHDLTKRYGNISGGVDVIKNHNFFENVDWAALKAKNFGPSGLRMPYTPVDRDSTCTDGQKMSYLELDEYNEQTRFPPIKVERDPFLNWF